MDERKAGRRDLLHLQKVGSYLVRKAIGRGNFATVYLAYHEHAKVKVAIKAINKQLVGAENLVKINREIEIMKTLDHPHVVKLYEVMQSEQYLYIVTEYCRGGELFDTLVERGRVTEDDAKRWFHQASSAVLYCHERGIVHRDLKAENILLDKNGDIKLIDFGFANYWRSDQLLNTWCGSPPYAAPELLMGKEYDGSKADVWSLGVLLYILVTGGFPFPGESIEKLKKSILNQKEPVRIPFWVSVECTDLLRKMLVCNPYARCSLNVVIAHRWMQGAAATTKQPERKELVNPALLVDRVQELNGHVAWFMGHKYPPELIRKEVANKNYDSLIYPTYLILCDKLKRGNVEDSSADNGEHSRRGSRGSIMSGKVDVEPELNANKIPAKVLAILNADSSEDEDSDDSDTSDDRTGYSPRARKKKLRNTMNHVNVDEAGTSRRYSEQILPPFFNHSQVNTTLQNAAYQQLAALARQAPQLFNAPVPNLMPGMPPQMPLFDLSMLPVPGADRRASASECFPLNQLFSEMMNNMNSPQIDHQLLASTSKAATPTIEEEGRRYLAQRGGNKRNTVHAMGGSPMGGSPLSRHAKSPYQKTPTANGERRSSWASPTVTMQQQANLEKLYRRTMQNSNSGVDVAKLQKEFADLGRLTLGLPSTSSAFTPTGLPSPAEIAAYQQLQSCPPVINITDEHNRNLGPPIGCNSATFANLHDAFNHQASELLYGQRPATVCGFASTNGFGQPGSSNASTPERTNVMGSPAEPACMAFTLSLEAQNILNIIRATLNEGNFAFDESLHKIEERDVTRLAITGTGVEIAVAPTIDESRKSDVEFSCAENDKVTSALCDTLIKHLRNFETTPVA